VATDAPLLQQITRSPLMIDETAQELFQASIQHVVSHARSAEFLASIDMAEDDNYWPMADDWRAAYRPYNVKNGVLQIPVMGVLLNRFSWQLGQWATGYQYIEKALQRGLSDPDVKAIAFIHNSPGGEVAGNFELVDKIYAARGQKPMRAFAADHCYSASYSLASAADMIVITRSGGVGSIGVVTAHVDYSDRIAQEGIKVTFIFAGKHKVDGNAYEKLPDAVKARIQTRINRIYGVFTSSVARNRAMDEAAVRATEALTYDASDALEVELADRVGSLEEEMVIFSDEAATGDEQMAQNDNKDSGITQEALDAAVTSAVATAKIEGLKEGATAERTRISAILASDEGKKRPKAAMSLAMKTGLSLEEASATLVDMPEEQAAAPVVTDDKKDKAKGANHFEEAMNASTPKLDAGGDEDGDEPKDMASSILADFRSATGTKQKQKQKAA
jgi:signal peptide peptidase SppA